ncbi:hypothetical protein ACG9Y7_18025 [Acinetobacter gerneri]|uniref:hypothetical protein n=1 Tax=Acinetobacter gerneri TaxID=202952 RepID=UPI003AF680DA
MNKIKHLLVTGSITFLSFLTMNNTSCAKTGNNMTSINLDNTQNWCLGRYTFVIPKEATFYQQRDQYDSFTIKKVQMNATQADFDKQTNYILSEYTKRSRQVINIGGLKR